MTGKEGEFGKGDGDESKYFIEVKTPKKVERRDLSFCVKKQTQEVNDFLSERFFWNAKLNQFNETNINQNEHGGNTSTSGKKFDGDVTGVGSSSSDKIDNNSKFSRNDVDDNDDNDDNDDDDDDVEFVEGRMVLDVNVHQKKKQKISFFYRHIKQKKHTPKGCLFMFHGLGSSSSFLGNIVNSLIESNVYIDIISFDQIGHGQSNGIWNNKHDDYTDDMESEERVVGKNFKHGPIYPQDIKERYGEKYSKPDNYIPDFKLLSSNCWDVMEAILQKNKDRGLDKAPLFLFGESMGAGTATIMSLEKYSLLSRVRGVILEAPPIHLCDVRSSFLQSVVTFTASIIPSLSASSASDIGTVTRIKEQNDLLTDHIECNPKGLCFGSAAALIHVSQFIKQNMHKMNIPMLLLHGTGDTVTDYSGSQQLYESNQNSDKTLITFEHAFHVLNRDLVCREEIQFIISWLKERI